MNKDLFFYSKFCNHCKDVINIITKGNVRELFIFVCVDDNRFRIPEFVTHVPTIVTKSRSVVSDDMVIDYIDRYIKTSSSSLPISPYQIEAGYSSCYTFLTENGYDNEGKMSEEKNSYIMIGDDHKIYTPKESDNSSSKTAKFDESTYEQYLNSRNLDDERMKRK